MYCTNCGKSLPDDTMFCTECGTRVSQDPTPAPAKKEAQTAVKPAKTCKVLSTVKSALTSYQPKERPETPAGKNAYFLNFAPAQIRMKALIAWGLTLVCLIVMLIGYSVTVNTSVENIPIMSLALDLSGEKEDFEDSKDMVSDALDELEDLLEDNEEELSEKLSKREMKLIDNLLEAYEQFAESFSINNTKKVVKAMEDIVSKGIEDELDLDDDLEDLEEVTAVLNIISTLLLIFTLFAAAFTVGGGAGRVTPLVAIGMVFSTINCLLYAGFLLVLLNLAAHIALIVFMTQINKDYREYRNSYKTA